MPEHAFILDRPAKLTSSVVFASPHSGRDYPSWFLERSILNARSIRSSEDAFVDALFAAAPTYGAPLLRSGAPRAFVDYNRSAEELDPALIAGVAWVGNNPRVSSGLGVIPRVVSNGRAIYRGKLTRAEADARISGYWRPYHATLQGLLNEAVQHFGEAILVDCHSMPHEAIDSVRMPGGRRPEIVLGDRFGASAHGEIVDAIEAAFQEAGFVVSRNAPFAGAYVTQHYGRPSRRQHAIQVEIDRALYMDEKRIVPSADFDGFKAALDGVIAKIATIGTCDQRVAAE
ncbi:N-formylglutamate amidohydrolase [Cognatishimia sp. SS12]|uniref:N-formylglutamate amidohydrolase n=1 Tax=Cognatishimia sp. SS12 TaxID=2979465 RepID=UPI00232F0FCF|nr:N-formylglutamate amidohydrolase [Cognatishimia sp. SS12]MDC0738032.1 N-formylglutamate amidohydrolase [Cognatishimia sp. SS12]